MPAARRTQPGRKIDSTNNIPRILDTTVPPGSLRGALTPPCSKSYAQRALAAALLAEGGSELHGIDFCDDTLSALRCIETLGARVVRSGPTLRIEGGLRPRGGRLFTGESGLATRLFTPIASLWHEPVRIEGEGTLLARPMGALLEPLRTLGVAVRPCPLRSAGRCGAGRSRWTVRSRRSSSRGCSWPCPSPRGRPPCG